MIARPRLCIVHNLFNRVIYSADELHENIFLHKDLNVYTPCMEYVPVVQSFIIVSRKYVNHV